jgi:hypothetical protein
MGIGVSELIILTSGKSESITITNEKGRLSKEDIDVVTAIQTILMRTCDYENEW